MPTKKDEAKAKKQLAMIEEKQTLVTKEGFKKLKAELEDLKTVKRREVAERIKEAISYGDLSENSEYEDAKNEQAFVEGRIMELEEKVKYAKIIDESQHKTASIHLGSVVTIKNAEKKNAESEEYVIVGSTEADPLNNKISNESPIGRELLDKKKGDIIEVMAPGGKGKYEVIKFV